MGQFGDKFRKEREKKGISLEDVSNVTKISSRMLQAIEQEQFDLLPGGVFNRGFIRAYAKHLGLNDEEAVTDYLACLRQAQIDAQANWQPEEKSASPRGPYMKPALKQQQPPQAGVEELPGLQLPRAEDVRPPRRDYAEKRGGGVPWTILAAATVVVLLAAALWFRESGKHSRTDAQAAGASPAAAPQQPAPLPVAPGASTTPRSNATGSSAPRLLASSSADEPAAKVPQTTRPLPTSANASPAAGSLATNATTRKPRPEDPSGAKSAQAVPSPPAPSSSTSASTSTASIASASDASLPAAPPSAASSAAAQPLTLIIRASETSWVSVTADGQPVGHETLIAPAHTTVRASREIVARIGNAAGVTFLWNGQEIPAQGAESEVKTYIFDAQGMREVPNQPASANPPVHDQ